MTPARSSSGSGSALPFSSGADTRTNIELARVLLALGRPQEAVAILQPAFRGELESSNLSVTHTELHELLGRVWEEAGRPDSAAVHYQRVLESWRNADPELHARRDTVSARLERLGIATSRLAAPIERSEESPSEGEY